MVALWKCLVTFSEHVFGMCPARFLRYWEMHVTALEKWNGPNSSSPFCMQWLDLQKAVWTRLLWGVPPSAQSDSSRTIPSSLPVLKSEMPVQETVFQFPSLSTTFSFRNVSTSSVSHSLKTAHAKYDQTKEARGRGGATGSKHTPHRAFRVQSSQGSQR